ncbi:MAG: hypothetical protein K2J63_01405 [Muribaculaceae bacterium]|nr:hypothetical protein [Muribaculaceae bacterium]
MKKKFVKVALLSLVTCSAPAAFVSCNNDDWKNPVDKVETSVEGINNTLTEMKGQVTALDSKISENKAAVEAAAKAAQAAMDAAQAAAASAEEAKKDSDEAAKKYADEAKKYADEAAQKFAEEAAAKAIAESAEQLKSEIEALMSIIEANKAAIAENKALIDGNSEKISANAGKIQGNTDAIAAILESVSSLQEGLDGLKDALNGVQGDLNGVKDDVAAKYAELATKLEEANVNISNLAGEMSDKVAGLNAAIVAVEGKCEALGLDITALKADVAAEIGTLEQNLAAQIAAEAARIAALEQADLDIKGLIADLSGKVENLALSSDLEKVSQFVQQAQTQITALEAFQTKMTSDFAALSSTVEGIDAKVEQNKAEIANLTAGLATVEAAAKTNATAIAAQAGLIKTNADAIAQNKVDIKNNADAIKTLVDGDIKDLKTFKQTYEAQLATLSKDLSDLGGKITTEVGAAVNTMTAMFMTNLRSLVFIPDAYVGGVESALSYHMDYLKLTARANNTNDVYSCTGNNGETLKVQKFKTWNLQKVDNQNNQKSYEAPTVISYHMNPESAVIDNIDKLKIVAKDAEMLTRDGGAGIALVKSYNDGKGFNAKDGILTVEITGNSKNYDADGTTMPIFALQAKVAGQKDEEGKEIENTVTSDYAVFAQMNVKPTAIQYNMNVYPGKFFNNSNRYDFQPVVTNVVDENGVNGNTNVQTALNHATTTTVKWNGTTDLLSVLEIAYVDEGRNGTEKSWTKPSDWEKYGLKMHFELLNYTIGNNTVSESSWASIDPETGVLTACVNSNVNNQSPDELGHMPLVYVTVTQGNDVVLNGFIKVKIVPSEDYYMTSPITFANVDFNCSDFGEQQKEEFAPLQMMLKVTELSEDVFLANYQPSFKKVDIDGDGFQSDVFIQYVKNADGIWTSVNSAKEIGYVLPRMKNLNGTHVYDIEWNFDDAYAKQLVYQQENHTATTYICFEGTSDVYADVYLPLTVSVNEKPTLAVGTKVLAKWFRENDNTALLNVPQPTNGNIVSTINANLDQLWTNDKPTFSPKPSDYLGYKYYFSALNNRTVDGITYSVANTTNPNLLNGYSAVSNANMGVNALLTNAANSEYGNTVLKANGVEIATLDQSTGKITYATTPAALELLNKFPSMGGEDRPEAKLGAIIGMVPYSSCDLAYTISNGDFNVAFLRPINVDEGVVYPFVDATANGSTNDVYNMLVFSDWRDVNFANQEWLYGYYNVKGITAQLDKMTSDIANPGSGKFEPVSPSLRSSFKFQQNGTDVTTANVSYAGTSISSGNSAAIKNLVKGQFGTITYFNSDVNVKQFKVKIPFVIDYELGSISVTIECTIKTTMGN